LAPEQLLLVPADQVALLAEEAVEDPGYTVGAAETAQHHRSRPRPVDLPVCLLHGPLEPAFDFRPSVVERLGYRGAAAEAIHRLKQGVDGRIGHLVAVERTLGELAHRKLTIGPDVPGIVLVGRLEHRHAPPGLAG